MAGTIIVDRIESDSSYASTINVAGQITFSNTVNFGATGQRITGDFSNATVANSVAFQTSTTNNNTYVNAIPNGTGNRADFRVFNNSDANNASVFIFGQTSTAATLNTTLTGTGSYLPMTFATGGSERMRIDTSGNVGIGTTSPAALAKLDVQGGRSYFASNSDAFSIYLRYNNSTSGVFLGSPSVGAFQISTSGGSALANIDSSANLQFNSGYGSVATAYGCRAWVNFNGSGTVAIRSSGNVSSITDNNVGNYNINFTTSLVDSNYCVTFGVGGGGSGLNAAFVAAVLTSTQYGTATNKSTTAVQITTGDYTATLRDFGEVYVSIFR